jgi:hypothetical protein
VAEPEPDFSLVAENRLVAYVWRRQGGALRRGDGKTRRDLATLTYAEIVTFDRRREDLLRTAAADSADLDAFLFAVQLEGLRVVAGRFVPNARHRRF